MSWSVPPGWRELPGDAMRFAAFSVSEAHPDIVATVIPLGPESGGLIANINRWLGQIGSPEIDETKLVEILTRRTIGGAEAAYAELSGPGKEEGPMRLLGAILPHDKRVWFFKLSGPAELVTAQQANFNALLDSIKLNSASPGDENQTDANPSSVNPAAGASVGFKLPPGWTQQSEKPLRIVSFTVAQDQQSAEVIVSSLPAGSGTYEENVNRWRGQVGLPPLSAGETSPSSVIRLDDVPEARYFDLVGPDNAPDRKRLLLVWAAHGQEWWFIKMLGPESLVAAQRDAFKSFLDSFRFHPSEGNP